MKILIKRKTFSDKQTLGELSIINASGNTVYKCKTLELPKKNNEKKVSCIPAGEYKVKKRYSAKYGNHFYVTNVPNRDMILIHHGNFFSDILGCILVGKTHTDINGDGYKDVTSSVDTIKELNAMLPANFTLTIVEI